MKKLLILVLLLVTTIALWRICPWRIIATLFKKQSTAQEQASLKNLQVNLTHLAIVMDGNRRWAKKNNLPAWQGHNEGVKALERTVDFCLENSIKILTCYVFSLENFKRSQEEKDHLFNLLIEHSNKFFHKLSEKQVRVRFVGDRSLFPESVRSTIESIEQATWNHNKLLVNMLFSYGGRQEILDAVQNIAHKYKQDNLDLATISAENFKKYLWLGDIPDPDLIIRTGGDQRLSNFLLYQAAYSELYFTNSLWPDFDVKQLAKAINYYNSCRRSAIGK